MSIYSDNTSLNTAYHKGVHAAQKLQGSTCPYVDHRTARGCVTFSRAFIRAWIAGYEDTVKNSYNVE